MRRSFLSIIGIVAAATANAETAGPPVPPPAKRSPAQQAIALYRAEHPGASQADSCPPPRRGEIIVCGSDRSPYRLPLPGERGAAGRARTATGDPDRAIDPGSPMPGPRGVGLQLKFPVGGSGNVGKPQVHGLGGEER